MITTSHETPEGRLTGAIDKYCYSHKYPLIAGVNGPRVKGWANIPDRIMGKETDDVYTKCILIEIKGTKESTIKDLLTKKEYKDVKYLAAIYYDNQGNMCGSLHSWRKPKGKLDLEEIKTTTPLGEFLDYLYNNVYLVATNPNIIQVTNDVYEAEKQGHSFEDILNVISGSFVDKTFSVPLDFSLEKLRKSCDKLKRPCDKIEVLHRLMFTESTRDERYKLGQFITEYPHSLHIAEEVIKIFDKHQGLVIYESCVGTGAIAEQLLILLYRKYGKRKALKIIKEQLRFADIDSKMRKYARTVLYLRTKELFGQGIHFKIEKNDLETDSFDLSKMIVYGNYPFNKGSDRNYLARLFKQQIKCGLSLGVFMGNIGTFDPRKVQPHKILGDEFYNYIEEKYTTNDFKKVACSICIVVFDKDRKTNKSMIDMERFTTLENFEVDSINYLPNFMPAKGAKFQDKSTLYSEHYNPTNSIPYIRQTDLVVHQVKFYIPSPNAPEGSKEKEVYDCWMEEWKYYPKIEKHTCLAVGSFTTASKLVRLEYFNEYCCVSSGVYEMKGNKQALGIIGLILQSSTFVNKLYMHFPPWQKTQYAVYANKLKTLPIPKNIPERLYEIGQKLIIEGKEDKKLRQEADEIIEQLYKDLEV